MRALLLMIVLCCCLVVACQKDRAVTGQTMFESNAFSVQHPAGWLVREIAGKKMFAKLSSTEEVEAAFYIERKTGPVVSLEELSRSAPWETVSSKKIETKTGLTGYQVEYAEGFMKTTTFFRVGRCMFGLELDNDPLPSVEIVKKYDAFVDSFRAAPMCELKTLNEKMFSVEYDANWTQQADANGSLLLSQTSKIGVEAQIVLSLVVGHQPTNSEAYARSVAENTPQPVQKIAPVKTKHGYDGYRLEHGPHALFKTDTYIAHGRCVFMLLLANNPKPSPEVTQKYDALVDSFRFRDVSSCK